MNLVQAATDQAKCRVGSMEVDADVNDEGVSCRVPAMAPGTIPILMMPNGRDVVHTSYLHSKAASLTPKSGAHDGNNQRRPRRQNPGVAAGFPEKARCSFSGKLSPAEVFDGGLRCVQPSLDEGTYDLSIDSSLGLLEPVLTYEVLSSVLWIRWHRHMDTQTRLSV